MKILPFGEKILVKRRRVGEKVGSIVLPENIQQAPTDLAEVVYVPDNTFADKELYDNATDIIKEMTAKAKEGNSDALIALLRYNEYLKIKSIKPKDIVMISRYVGTDFHSNETVSGNLTLVNGSDIIAIIQGEK